MLEYHQSERKVIINGRTIYLDNVSVVTDIDFEYEGSDGLMERGGRFYFSVDKYTISEFFTLTFRKIQTDIDFDHKKYSEKYDLHCYRMMDDYFSHNKVKSEFNQQQYKTLKKITDIRDELMKLIENKEA